MCSCFKTAFNVNDISESTNKKQNKTFYQLSQLIFYGHKASSHKKNAFFKTWDLKADISSNNNFESTFCVPATQQINAKDELRKLTNIK